MFEKVDDTCTRKYTRHLPPLWQTPRRDNVGTQSSKNSQHEAGRLHDVGVLDDVLVGLDVGAGHALGAAARREQHQRAAHGAHGALQRKVAVHEHLPRAADTCEPAAPTVHRLYGLYCQNQRYGQHFLPLVKVKNHLCHKILLENGIPRRTSKQL